MVSLLAEQATPETVVVRVGTTLDFRNAASFKGLCRQQLAQGLNKFVLDFSDTRILDSTGLGAIFSIYREINPQGGRVSFAAVSRPVQAVVQATHTYKVFPQYESVNAATGL